MLYSLGYLQHMPYTFILKRWTFSQLVFSGILLSIFLLFLTFQTPCGSFGLSGQIWVLVEIIITPKTNTASGGELVLTHPCIADRGKAVSVCKRVELSTQFQCWLVNMIAYSSPEWFICFVAFTQHFYCNRPGGWCLPPPKK